MSAPPEKKQKVEEGEAKDDAEMKDAEPAAEAAADATMATEEVKEEVPKELEEDEEPGKAATVKEPTTFLVQDTTMNVMSSTTQNLLMPLSDGGFQHLLACARASTGVKGGRYMFEVKVVEFVNPVEDGRRYSGPKQQLRLGFATSTSSLFFGDSEESAAFDTSDGQFFSGKKKTPFLKKIYGSNLQARESVLAVVLNLNAGAQNENTVSLFKDGERVSEPQALPEAMRGKPLYPMINFRNMTVYANFGKEVMKSLPFKCKTIQDTPAKDAKTTPSDLPEGGKYEVVFPVSLPDEGTFDWLDLFLESSKKKYTELSDRMIIDWAVKSGLYRARPNSSSNDKPEYGFGVAFMDDFSVRRMLMTLAPTQQRNYVVMEIKSNLIPDERKVFLEKFPSSSFTKVAKVVCGEPKAAFIKNTEKLVLKAKQDLSDNAHRLKLAEAKRKKQLEKAAKEKEKAQKKALKEAAAAKKAAEKAAAQAAKEKAKKEAEEKGEPVPEEEEAKEEEPEPMEEEEPEEPEEKEEEDEPFPTVELTEEEKKLKFRPVKIPDMLPVSLAMSFTKFEIPTKEEGFDNVTYEWATETKAKEYIKNWILNRKITTRVEDLNPSDWVAGKLKEFVTSGTAWQTKHSEYKVTVAKKLQEREARKAMAARKAEIAKAAEEAKKKMEEAKKAAEEAKAAEEPKEGEEPKPEGEETKPEEAAAPAEEKKDEEMKEEGEAKEAEPMEVDDAEACAEEEKAEEEIETEFADLDVFGVEEVTDALKGKPLFKDFGFEDWALLALRYEVHLLVHGFRNDVKDPERVGIHVDHLGFYYQKYFKKNLLVKTYGVDTTEELLKLIDDTVYITKQKVIESQLPPELETADVFVKLAEEARRYRNCKVDLGDDSFKLKMASPAVPGGFSAPKGVGKGWQAPKGFEKGGFDRGFDKGGCKGKDWKGNMQGKGDCKGGKPWSDAGKPTWQTPSAPKSDWSKGWQSTKGGSFGVSQKGGWQSTAPRLGLPGKGK